MNRKIATAVAALLGVVVLTATCRSSQHDVVGAPSAASRSVSTTVSQQTSTTSSSPIDKTSATAALAPCAGDNPYEGLTVSMLASSYDLNDPLTKETVRFLTEEVGPLRAEGACVAMVMVRPPAVFLKAGTDSPTAEDLVRSRFAMPDKLTIYPSF